MNGKNDSSIYLFRRYNIIRSNKTNKMIFLSLNLELVNSYMLVDEKIENKEIAKQYKELLKISYQHLKLEDKKLIRLAFNTAVDAHKHREENLEKHIFSPISVAKIVASEIGLDATSISAALLHDTIEDTNYKLLI